MDKQRGGKEGNQVFKLWGCQKLENIDNSVPTQGEKEEKQRRK